MIYKINNPSEITPLERGYCTAMSQFIDEVQELKPFFPVYSSQDFEMIRRLYFEYDGIRRYPFYNFTDSQIIVYALETKDHKKWFQKKQ